MKRLILYIIVSFLLVNCKAPSYLPKEHKIGEVEYFDFDDYYKNKKNRFNEYYIDREDTIKIVKSIGKDYIFEIFTVYPKNYRLMKDYYPNGVIKERGKEYFSPDSDNFKIGIWEYFDERGHLIRTEDKDGKDRDYKIIYKEAFRRVCWHYGFSMKGVRIEKFINDGKLYWVFTKKGKSRAVEIETGKVKKVSILYEM